MTYEGQTARRINRVLIALVVIMIVVVALWAINGGLDDVPTWDQTTTVPD